MKHYHRIPLMLCSFCAVSLFIIAQNNTNLPTSMYGVGELSTSDGGRYAGMGNIGIGDEVDCIRYFLSLPAFFFQWSITHLGINIGNSSQHLAKLLVCC